MTMIARITCRQCSQPCELAGYATCASYPKIDRAIDRDETIKRIRQALAKRSGRQWSVKGGRGTAWGWIRISVPPSKLGCARLHEFDWQTNVCTACDSRRFGPREPGDAWSCSGHVCTDTCYRRYITPEDREELAGLLGLTDVHFQGQSIPSGGDYYVEYIDRAEGRTPRTFGVPYWD